MGRMALSHVIQSSSGLVLAFLVHAVSDPISPAIFAFLILSVLS